MTVSEALTLGAARLARLPDPRREARLLLAHALELPSAALFGRADQPVPPAAAAGFTAAVARRAAGTPLALITGQREFWSLDLRVSPVTLIPRADSETLIEAALALPPEVSRPGRILDLGTGTGCLLLAALTEFPAAWGLGIDRVPEAAALARANAARLGLSGRAAFVCADWAKPIGGYFELILCNPPYIETAAIPGLMPEVAQHEPASALDGGADGLAAYRALLPALPGLLTPAGAAILELGAGQAAAVTALAAAAGFCSAIQTDLAGIPRALILRRSAA
ncbi:MAG: peptide chain release factor N(5)-glutamine methyltransferase [Acetobacteraceae bacterium]